MKLGFCWVQWTPLAGSWEKVKSLKCVSKIISSFGDFRISALPKYFQWSADFLPLGAEKLSFDCLYLNSYLYLLISGGGKGSRKLQEWLSNPKKILQIKKMERNRRRPIPWVVCSQSYSGWLGWLNRSNAGRQCHLCISRPKVILGNCLPKNLFLGMGFMEPGEKTAY